jgi:hypothetical protein
MTTHERRAPQWLLDDPDKLGDAQRGLEQRGIVAELSLRSDGTVVIETEASAADINGAIADLVPVLRPERVADQTDREILTAYLANSAPTNAQSVAAIKALIRVVARFVRQ